MSHYWAGDNAWTNPPSQALPWRREGSGGGLEYGSGAFDVTNQSWPYLTASDTLDGFLDHRPFKPMFLPPVSTDDEMQHIFNQLGPNEFADSGTGWNADQFDFNGISPFPSCPPSSASVYIPGAIRKQTSGIIKVWIADVPDPDAAIARWWKQKLQHFWLLPAMI
ncbi:hypothetical protein B0H13DRAFT_2315663 [Mycena leptocephala]|nr:hypothetical protein B0H13DRAFT_2315663 [Mycena leptocephala]